MLFYRQRRSIINLKSVGKLVCFLLFTLLYCEYIHYYTVIYQCNWPKIHDNDDVSKSKNIDNEEPLRAMILADTHLLGKRRGHWFDKLRREWQMHRAYQTAIQIHQPDVVIILGDLFDEGSWAKPEEFKEYVDRFNSLFYLPNNSTKLLIAAGNHDMGFHYSLYPYIVTRFDEAFRTSPVQVKQIKGINFVIINSMALHRDSCFLCQRAENHINVLSKQLECARGNKIVCQHWHNPALYEYSSPVLLQHFPLYRESDELCEESDEAPAEEKGLQFREKWECLSRESTEYLIEKLEPRVAFSGHTHHGCETSHRFVLPDDQVLELSEFTIPSFSWRNKKNPTFSMVTLTPDNYSVYKCHMPKENTVICLYFLSILFIIYWTLRKKIKLERIDGVEDNLI